MAWLSPLCSVSKKRCHDQNGFLTFEVCKSEVSCNAECWGLFAILQSHDTQRISIRIKSIKCTFYLCDIPVGIGASRDTKCTFDLCLFWSVYMDNCRTGRISIVYFICVKWYQSEIYLNLNVARRKKCTFDWFEYLAARLSLIFSNEWGKETQIFLNLVEDQDMFVQNHFFTEMSK